MRLTLGILRLQGGGWLVNNTKDIGMELIKRDTNALAIKSKESIAKCEKAMAIWNHSRSAGMLKSMTIGGEYSPMRRLRQVAAEMTRKKQAMNEAKHNVRKKSIRIKMLKRGLESLTDELEREMAMARIEELQDTISSIEGPYIGAMQEVQELAAIHDALVSQITEEYGKFDEEVFEKEESRYWVKRGFGQALREVRECGRIKCGNQELLEQIGINPTVALKMIQDHLKTEEQSMNMSSDMVENFLDTVADKGHSLTRERIMRLGFNPEVITDHLLIEGE